MNLTKAIVSRALIIVLTVSVITRCRLSANDADQTPEGPSSANTSGITDVSLGGPALTEPSGDTKGQVLRYGLGLVFQVAPRTAAVSCNIRTIGTGHWDFENGTDVVVFNDIATIGRQERIAVARNEEDVNPITGRKRVAVTYPIQVGFVPLGAKRPDGVVYPHAGTGFGFSQALCFDVNNEGYYTPAEAKAGGQDPSSKRWYLHQFTYDGQTFGVAKREIKSGDSPLNTTDGAWTIIAPGLSVAIADGDDLLLPVLASDGKREVAGVSRWCRTDGDWRPSMFYGISDGTEPSLIRDVDGSLIYSARGHGQEGETVRVWQSRDSGQNWQQCLNIPTLRSNAPVTLVNAADGTPCIAANQPGSFRATLCLWPLNTQRTDYGPAIVARDCLGSFGPAPKGTTWFADHPTATTVQLADGEWHGLLGYRVMAFSTDGVGAETPTPRTGCYIEQVNSTGPARLAWQF